MASIAPVADVPQVDDLIAQLEPVLHRHAAISEADRKLASEVMNALLDAGLNRIWLPKSLGGMEMEPVPALRLFEALSRVDASAGWIVGNGAAGPLFGQLFPDEGASEIFAGPRTLTAGALNPPGMAFPVEGGYRVSGQWPFASGCNYAAWMMGLCLVMDGASPRLGPDGTPSLLIVACKMQDCEILDTWHTLGMRGTGSHDVRANDVLVPNRRTVLMGPWDSPGSAFRGPLYRMGPWPVFCQVALNGLGIARAALDEFIALAASKTPSYAQTGLADRSVVQDGVARANAQIEAARSYIYACVSTAWEYVQDGSRLSAQEGIPLALAATFGLESAVKAVRIVHDLAGTSAIRNEQPFQQHFRDVHTISQHAFAATSRFESVGKLLLGRPSDWPLYYV